MGSRPATLSTSEAIEAVLSDRPDVVSQLGAAHAAAWRAVEPRLLELCRLRIAMLLDCTSEAAARTAGIGVDEATIAELASWPTSTRFDQRDRACLAFCEHYVIDVASLTDELAAGVTEHLGPQGLVDFVSALIVIEQRQRLRLAWSRLLGEGEVPR
jgi:alkylhydroperoxidase family enzyme